MQRAGRGRRDEHRPGAHALESAAVGVVDGRIDGISGLLFGWALLQPRIGLLPGMAISAWERGSQAWPSPQRLAVWTRHAGAVALMGLGAALVPGGNDTLLPGELVTLAPAAVAAYVAMLLGTASMLCLMRLARRRSQDHRGHRAGTRSNATGNGGKGNVRSFATGTKSSCVPGTMMYGTRIYSKRNPSASNSPLNTINSSRRQRS